MDDLHFFTFLTSMFWPAAWLALVLFHYGIFTTKAVHVFFWEVGWETIKIKLAIIPKLHEENCNCIGKNDKKSLEIG